MFLLSIPVCSAFMLCECVQHKVPLFSHAISVIVLSICVYNMFPPTCRFAWGRRYMLMLLFSIHMSGSQFKRFCPIVLSVLNIDVLLLCTVGYHHAHRATLSEFSTLGNTYFKLSEIIFLYTR